MGVFQFTEQPSRSYLLVVPQGECMCVCACARVCASCMQPLIRFISVSDKTCSDPSSFASTSATEAHLQAHDKALRVLCCSMLNVIAIESALVNLGEGSRQGGSDVTRTVRPPHQNIAWEQTKGRVESDRLGQRRWDSDCLQIIGGRETIRSCSWLCVASSLNVAIFAVLHQTLTSSSNCISHALTKDQGHPLFLVHVSFSYEMLRSSFLMCVQFPY